MEKILIIETAALNRKNMGGSYLQSKYYMELLQKKKYYVEILQSGLRENMYKRVLKVINKIRNADLIIGFGTPILNIYLQWLSFLFKKKGLFCIDTIAVPIDIIREHMRDKNFSIKILTSNLKDYLLSNISSLLPPKLNLVNLASCKYVKDKLKKTAFFPKENKFLYPKVEMKEGKQRENKKNKIVLFYGALYRGRGVIDFVRACRILWQKEYKFKLMILGWPVELLTKKALITEIRDEEKDKIILKEKVKNVLKFVENSSMVVLPFRYPCSFQTPYTLLEPMGLGIPVITTDVGSHGEWIKDRETGLICEKENIQDIARRIELIFNDVTLVKRMTQNAYKLLEERYKKKDLLLETLKKLEHER